MDPNLVSYTNFPVLAESPSPLQLIKKVTDQKVVEESLSSLFHFLAPSTEFLALALVGYLLYWIVSWLFSWFRKPVNQLPSGRNLQTKILAFFLMLYLFCIKEIYSNLLNTNNVIVQTDDLLYSKEQILETRKEFCFWEKGSETTFMENVSMENASVHIVDLLRKPIELTIKPLSELSSFFPLLCSGSGKFAFARDLREEKQRGSLLFVCQRSTRQFWATTTRATLYNCPKSSVRHHGEDGQ